MSIGATPVLRLCNAGREIKQAAPSDSLTVFTAIEFLDVGGAATLVRTPSGARVLIDGGANPSALPAALGSRMPFWDRSLDLIVLADPDDNQLAGLVAALEQYKEGQLCSCHLLNSNDR